MARYIFVAGGVMSGIGKGVATASIGKILQSKGFRVTAVKIDPYVNVDAGTMNPIEHGEVFVTADGTECDQDVGNYERFIDENLSTNNYITTGRVYEAVIRRERNLEYGGKCVEVVPHIPEEVIARIKKAARLTRADFVLIEIGGTVGEYQNSLFLEAARMMRLNSPQNVLFVLITYLPIPGIIGEMKTKPTQQAVRWLNMAGIQPDMILARSVVPLDLPRKKKISVFCSVAKEDVISAPDVKSIYEVPLNFEKDSMGDRILKKFGLRAKHKGDLRDWKKLSKTIKTVKNSVKIGIVGKYFETGKFTLTDSYISVIEAVKHACWFNKRKPEIHWLSSEVYEKNPRLLKELKDYDGIIVPGGFGSRGIEGKIKAIEFCRKNKIPYFGLCLGMQLAVIEFARHVCGLRKANSAEFAPNGKENVIDVMPDQDVLLKEKKYGGTMRLGEYQCRIKPNTLAFKAYGASSILERHRHRYEVNNAFRSALEKRGMVMSGLNPERDLVEIAELKEHPFFLGTQFHPEFKSRPTKPHPLFREFIKAASRSRGKLS
ncbi:MAG: CTP synthetase [Parcubacteria group bacterium GW2011_GWA1_48_11b]|uniref:CTP synthase n=2 Tax=Candidatus Nealsoniibacteriota TaxID=1817911 RepID=A0A1G2E925_9BACT|nr:MAG: CTP synthetase [Parcubacteria group bacterium GW2011_GWA1_48_11b]OGZ19788.1 MAG: CTP synthase [Candidatus Nealsonbacteria bacterium RIFCSPHIGHO2_01_FULL_43_31]OGZ22357.1 MAG: CTP synthase [Candidatus Nealsonbacteria bacterium RIFCSPHIGHO2_02_FULL_43_13]OGZ25270.1 MAG: CTP synthase [Candidatus Nealsonbacteria bacterium RIFCSPLOWO2_01_FULL_43_36]